MKRFLFTTLFSNDLGLLTRSLPIARELAGRGHRVAFCNPLGAPSRLIGEAGFENLVPPHPLFYLKSLDLRGLAELVRSGVAKREFGGLARFLKRYASALPLRGVKPTKEVWDADHFAALLRMGNRRFVEGLSTALAKLIKSWGADVVVDAWNPWACIGARMAERPLASILQADMHPDSPGFIWWKDRPPGIPTPAPVVNEVLSQHGLAPVTKVAQLLVGDLTLVLGTPESDPLPPGAAATYIGAVLWESRASELPEWREQLRSDVPVVWVYPGNPSYGWGASWADSAVVLRACVAALAREDVQVVLTTGHHPLPKGTLPLPPNFRHELFVPGLAMARRSDLMIHHGGFGSCQTGFVTGTPALVLPTYSERESNARRVASVGAGEFLVPPTRATGTEPSLIDGLRSRVRLLLSDPSYARNAKRIGEEMAALGGAEEAARKIEQLAA
jgi:UDP:flavonoid glycosyltransferase YjiC (YdhE family)